jgi:hypothetical protein
MRGFSSDAKMMVNPMAVNFLGFAASLAVLATFLMRTMSLLRAIAIGSNILFIAYGYCTHLLPVLCLHIALLPINIARLRAGFRRPKSVPRMSPRGTSRRFSVSAVAAAWAKSGRKTIEPVPREV